MRLQVMLLQPHIRLPQRLMNFRYALDKSDYFFPSLPLSTYLLVRYKEIMYIIYCVGILTL